MRAGSGKGVGLFEAGDRARAELAYLIDRQMSPLGLAAMDALAPRSGETILDVGCGAGQTILQLADRVGPSGRVIGVDVAPCVLAEARRRTAHVAQAELLLEDAAVLQLPDETADRIFSRFGVMSFAEPVAAFANLRRMLRAGGAIGFICWRSLRDNELDRFCTEAAGVQVAGDSSPFLFEEPARISDVLASAGFAQIVVSAHDAPVHAGDAAATFAVVTRVGALGAYLRARPEEAPQVEGPLRAALRRRERDGLVWLNAATWIVTAASRTATR